MKKHKKGKREKYSKFILNVEARSSTELVKHKKGPGTRFVFSDYNNNPKGKLYAITRIVKNIKNPKPHVESHSHPVDSLWIFEGNTKKLTGLEAEVKLDGNVFAIHSPASVYIPRGITHSYRFISGSGKFMNIVLTDGKQYNEVTK